MYATCLIYIWDVTHSYVKHVSFTWDMTHSSVVCTVGLGARQGVPRFSKTRHVTHMNESYYSYEYGMSHLCMSHGAHMNESCRTYQWVMMHIWKSHVTHINESYYSYEWVMSHLWTSHGANMNVSCRTYQQITVHIWMSHVTQRNNSYYAYKDSMSHITHSYVWHDSFISATCFIHMWLIYKCHTYEWSMWHGLYDMTSIQALIYECHMLRCICVGVYDMTRTRHVGVYDMTSIQALIYESHMNEACGTYKWVMSHIWMSHAAHMQTSHVLHEACYSYEWGSIHKFMSYTWRLVMSHTWIIVHSERRHHVVHVSYMWMSHFTHMNESCHTYEWVMSHIWMSHVTHMNESCHTYEW